MADVRSAMKDRAILLGWIVGLVLIAALAWSLSFSFRAAGLMQVANTVLADQGDERRLVAPLSAPHIVLAPLGGWYSIADSDSLFFVFAILRDGILVPCAVELSSQGKVIDLIPLGNHARKVIGRIPQGVMQMYTRRIETAAEEAVRSWQE